MAVSHSYVYLMVERDGRAFKIGTSINPRARSYQLANEIDYDRSIQFKFDGRQAAKAERMLHFLFRAFRQEREKSDGFTEWFEIDSLPMAKRFLWTMRELVGWTEWSPITPIGGTTPGATPEAVAMTQAAARKALNDAHAEVERQLLLERQVRRNLEKARLEAEKIRALTDRGLSAAAAKATRKPKRPPPGAVKVISLAHLPPDDPRRDPRRWVAR